MNTISGSNAVSVDPVRLQQAMRAYAQVVVDGRVIRPEVTRLIKPFADVFVTSRDYHSRIEWLVDPDNDLDVTPAAARSLRDWAKYLESPL
jgi:hypothetical protein